MSNIKLKAYYTGQATSSIWMKKSYQKEFCKAMLLEWGL
jgi:hypothetical protein